MSFLPKVSVAMPVYNGGDFFELALNSVLAQTFQNIEIVVVNDGSSDQGHTDAVVRRYVETDRRIKYISQPNQGVAGALNTVIMHATGEYFAWLSHDDLFLPNKIESQLAFLEKIPNKDASLFSDYTLIDENGAVICDVRHDPEKFVRKPKLCLLGGGINGCTLLIPMRVMREHGLFDLALRYSQDYDFWHRILQKTDFFHQPEVLVKYRIHSGQGTQKEGATIEGDALWTKLLEDRPDLEKVQLFGSSRKYYLEMAKFLDATPYKKAMAIALGRAAVAAQPSHILVSVIIPFFNEISSTMAAVTSVTAQTHCNIELILVNDGSTEPIEPLLDLIRDDVRIRLVNQTNKGCAEARNVGLRMATGEYIAFLDADDVFLPQKIEKQLAAMQESGAVMSHTSYFVHFPKQSTKRGIGHAGRFSGQVYPRIIRVCPIATPTVMWHSSLVSEGYRFPPTLRLGEDIVLWTEIAQRHDILGIDEPLSEVELDQHTAALNPRKSRDGLENLVKYFKADPLHSKNENEIASLEIQRDELNRAAAAGGGGDGRTDVMEMFFGPSDDVLEEWVQVRNSQGPANTVPRHAKHEVEQFASSWSVSSDGENILFFTHTWGGGIERHVADMTMLLRAEGITVLHCRPSSDGEFVIVPAQHDGAAPLTFDQSRGVEEFAGMLRTIGISHIHVHSLSGFRRGTSDFIMQASALANAVYDVTLHDYMTICPRIHLVDHTGIYCGEPDLIDCERCIARNGSPFGKVCVAAWRAQYRRLLQGARGVFVPNIDVGERLRRYFPEVRFVLRPHPDRSSHPNLTAMRVVLIGTLLPHKGSLVVAATARAAKRAGLPLRFIILGETDCDDELAAIGNVTLEGAYQEHEATDRLLDLKADLAWFPSVCPETYSYTLSLAISAGVPCAAFDIGAISQRVSELKNGRLMPLSLISDPATIARKLMEYCSAPSTNAPKFAAHYYDIDA